MDCKKRIHTTSIARVTTAREDKQKTHLRKFLSLPSSQGLLWPFALHQCNSFHSNRAKHTSQQNSITDHNSCGGEIKRREGEKDLKAFLNWSLEVKQKQWIISDAIIKNQKIIHKFLVEMMHKFKIMDWASLSCFQRMRELSDSNQNKFKVLNLTHFKV